MPDNFVLECLTDTGGWIDWAKCRAIDFARCDDGAYVCTGHAGSPIWIRCLRQDGTVLYCIDGGGLPYTYRLVPFPGGGYGEPST
jgi:hypothetical protein